MSKKIILTYFGIGCVVAIHWLTFYASIKASNASITLVCLATATFFTALIEPLVMKQKVNPLQLAIGVAIFPGMLLIVNSTDGVYNWGIILGFISAILAALFGALNKRWLGDENPLTVTFIEMFAATVLLTICLPFIFKDDLIAQISPSKMDWVYLLILAVVCTNIAYLLALRVLRHLTAYISALTINLEPVYGILLAALLLGQHNELNTRFYLGAAIILLAVIGYPIIERRIRIKNN